MTENLTLKAAGLLTRQQAADRLDVSLMTLTKLVSEGRLVPIRQEGIRWMRFRASDIDDYIRRVLSQGNE